MFFMFKTPINKRRSNTIYPLQKHHKFGGINKGIKKIIFNKLGVIIYKRKERTHKTKHSQKAFKKSHISSNTAFFYQKQNN